jgi:hypothetical protein
LAFYPGDWFVVQQSIIISLSDWGRKPLGGFSQRQIQSISPSYQSLVETPKHPPQLFNPRTNFVF